MILELKEICMTFESGDSIIEVLNRVNFEIEKGQSVALVGPSGSGKSTLLQISALLETPTSGEVVICGHRVTNKSSDDVKTELRRKHLGFVYQFHNLLPEFSALENVMIPLLMRGIVSKKEAEGRAVDLLKQVGLGHRLNQSPKKLSGGEQQRVAIARALVTDPDIIIADEPTGNLDPSNAEVVFDIFLRLIKEKEMSVFMATHNLELAAKLDKTISLLGEKV